MNQEEWLSFHKASCDSMYEISKSKSNDYSGTENVFNNFMNVERLGITSTEEGFLVRMTDKLARLSQFCKTGVLKVKDESVEDTLLDLCNYSLLMAAYIKEKKHNET